jgi:hypothetical protein
MPVIQTFDDRHQTPAEEEEMAGEDRKITGS